VTRAVRLALATAFALPILLTGTADAGLRDTCWEWGPTFRVAALICPRLPNDR
jgi:hypothetical protein